MVKKYSYRDEFRAKKTRKFLLKASLFLVGFFIIVGGVIYFLFFSGVFEIRDVKISGLAETESNELRALVDRWLDSDRLFLKKGANSIFLSKGDLTSELTDKFKWIDSVAVKKNSIHNLDINVIQRKPAGIWCFKSSRCFYFDNSGVAYQEAAKSKGFIITNITDMRNEDPSLGSKISSEEWYRNIILTKDLLPRIEVEVAEVLIKSDSFDEFEIKTPDGWAIIFALSTDVQKQISALRTFLKEKMTPEKIKTLNYVDLRIQDRIYYK